MNARIFTATTLAIAFCGVLPARAADPQLLNLVMPDAKVIAGVNVDQAKGTPFGLYVLSQVNPQDKDLQQLIAVTGFDPTRDVREVLAASTGDPKSHTGLVLARGNFDAAKITAAAATHGVVQESYNGVNILSNSNKNSGMAFLDGTIAVAGDLAGVKAAIDRHQKAPTSLPAALGVRVNQWSTTQDAWFVADVPVSLFKFSPSSTAPQVPGLAGTPAFQAIQQAAGGIKFGNNVVLTAQAQTDTPDNAKALASVVQLLVNLAQTQAQQNAQAAALVKALTVGSSGNTLSLTLNLPEDQFQQLVGSKPKIHSNEHRRPARQL
jgi:hypothetical protein